MSDQGVNMSGLSNLPDENRTLLGAYEGARIVAYDGNELSTLFADMEGEYHSDVLHNFITGVHDIWIYGPFNCLRFLGSSIETITVFDNGNWMILEECPELTTVAIAGHVDQLHILKCGKILALSGLPGVQCIYAQECAKLKEIGNCRVLESLSMRSCARMKKVCDLPCLSRVSISDCPLLTRPTGLEVPESCVVLPQME